MSTENADHELPRFLIATMRYETFLGALARQLTEAKADVPRVISDTMLACSGLMRVAQNYEFVSTHPDLADTQAPAAAAQAFIDALAQPAIPDDVRQIYTELYGEELIF